MNFEFRNLSTFINGIISFLTIKVMPPDLNLEIRALLCGKIEYQGISITSVSSVFDSWMPLMSNF